MPNISVILPTYNRKRVINRAIQSVLLQTYQDFELIIIDDGSTDDTETLILALPSEKIKYVRHGEKKGVSAARNTGIKLATGDYLAFQDSDDEWMPDKLEKQLQCFKASSPEIGVVFTGSYNIKGRKKIYEPSASQARVAYNNIYELIRRYMPPTTATMVKRECFEKAGLFDKRLAAFEDHEIFIRIAKHYRFRYIPEPMVVRYNEPEGRSTKREYGIKDYKILLETHFDDIQRDHRALASCYLTLGHFLYSAGSHTEGKNYFLKSIRTYPLDIRVYFVWLIALLGNNAYNAAVRGYRQLRWIAFRR